LNLMPATRPSADKPEKPRQENSAEWDPARANRFRKHGFAKMAEEHELIEPAEHYQVAGLVARETAITLRNA
jgi:hypothetical protein